MRPVTPFNFELRKLKIYARQKDLFLQYAGHNNDNLILCYEYSPCAAKCRRSDRTKYGNTCALTILIKLKQWLKIKQLRKTEGELFYFKIQI